jgi:hypothetical protein
MSTTPTVVVCRMTYQSKIHSMYFSCSKLGHTRVSLTVRQVRPIRQRERMQRGGCRITNSILRGRTHKSSPRFTPHRLATRCPTATARQKAGKLKPLRKVWLVLRLWARVLGLSSRFQNGKVSGREALQASSRMTVACTPLPLTTCKSLTRSVQC